MAITGLLVLIVLFLGLAVWFYCVGISKASIGEAGKIAFTVALLAFLMSSAAQSCSMGVGTSSAQHR